MGEKGRDAMDNPAAISEASVVRSQKSEVRSKGGEVMWINLLSISFEF
jgi:hypothetical protein